MTLKDFVSALDCDCRVTNINGDTGAFTLRVSDDLNRHWLEKTVCSKEQFSFDTAAPNAAWDAKVMRVSISSITPVYTDLPDVTIHVTVDSKDINL